MGEKNEPPGSCVHLRTYRKCVCAIVLPHLQQGHHHFMELISRQNPITVHIEHFEANWKREKRDVINMLPHFVFVMPRVSISEVISSSIGNAEGIWNQTTPSENMFHTSVAATEEEIAGNRRDKKDLGVTAGFIHLRPFQRIWRLTFLPLSNRPPAASRQSTGDLFKVDVIVPILIEGVK